MCVFGYGCEVYVLVSRNRNFLNARIVRGCQSWVQSHWDDFFSCWVVESDGFIMRPNRSHPTAKEDFTPFVLFFRKSELKMRAFGGKAECWSFCHAIMGSGIEFSDWKHSVLPLCFLLSQIDGSVIGVITQCCSESAEAALHLKTISSTRSTIYTQVQIQDFDQGASDRPKNCTLSLGRLDAPVYSIHYNPPADPGGHGGSMSPLPPRFLFKIMQFLSLGHVVLTLWIQQ